MTNYSTALFAVVLAAATSRSDAFTATRSAPRTRISFLSSSKTETEGAVATASIAAAEDPKDVIPDFSSSTTPMDESSIFSGSDEDAATTWQENLEALLAPDTAVAKRQIVLSDLLNAAPEIQESVRTALKERKVSNQSFFPPHIYLMMCATHLTLSVFVFSSSIDRWAPYANSKEIARRYESCCETNHF